MTDHLTHIKTTEWQALLLSIGGAQAERDRLIRENEALQAEVAHHKDVLESYIGTYTREKERAERAEAALMRAQGAEADLAATLIRAERAEAEIAVLKADALRYRWREKLYKAR